MSIQSSMSPTLVKLEQCALDRLEIAYRRRGYEFYRGHATRSVLPESLSSLTPDAIALGAGGSELIEILGSRRLQGEERVQGMRKLLQKEPGWKLNVVYVDEVENEEQYLTERSSPVSLAEEAHALSNTHPRAALLLYWSALEGLLHECEPALVQRPITQLQLIDVLDSYDYVNSSERAELKRAATLRNALSHGAANVVDVGAVAIMASVVGRLAEIVKQTKSATE